MHVLFSSKNPASNNIARRLAEMGFEEKGESEWMWNCHRMLDTKAESILDVPTDFQTDWLLVLYTHRSEKKFPAFTVHIPGNWDKAEMGGSPRTLNIAYASRMKDLLRALSEKNTLGLSVNQEVDHHGPTCKLPIIFIEIGSSEEEWGNRKAAEIVAEAVMDSINEKKIYPSYIGAGGGHYAPFFTKLVLESEEAFGHILPKYQAANVGADTLRQAVEKNVEKVDALIYERKSFKAPERDRLFAIAKEIGLEVEVR
jgi:D-aminoacyl-tRNA deacylase